MTAVSRRSLLGSAAAGAVAAAIPAVATAATPDPIIALYHQLQAARREEALAVEACRLARAKLPAWADAGICPWNGERGWPEIDAETRKRLEFCFMIGTRPSLEDVRRTNSLEERDIADLPVELAKRRRQGEARLRVVADRIREQAAEFERCGVKAAERRADAAVFAQLDLIEAIIRAPVVSAAGLAAKVGVYQRQARHDEGTYEAELLTSIIADVERMAAAR